MEIREATSADYDAGWNIFHHIRLFLLLTLCVAHTPLKAQFYTLFDYTKPCRLYIPYREGNLWGYCDTTGQVVLTPQYDSLGFFEGEATLAAIFKKKDEYGVLNEQFTEVMRIKNTCTDLWWDKYNHFVVVKSGGKTGVLSSGYQMSTYEEIPIEFDSVSFEFMPQGGYIKVVQAGKWGLFRERDQLAPTEFDELFSAADFQETAELNGKIGRKKDRYFRVAPSGTQYELKDTSRRLSAMLTQQQYDAMHTDKVPSYTRDRLMKQTESLRSTKAISKILFDRGVGFSEGRYEYILVEKDKKVALLDVTTGKIRSAFYDDIIGYIDSGPVTLTEGNTGDTQHFFSILLVKKGKKYGIVSGNDQGTRPFTFDGFGEITSRAIVTRQNKKEGLINLYSSYPTIPCKYDKIRYHKQMRVDHRKRFAVYQVSQNGKPGYVGENGVEFFKDR